jgi:hypothetical protein
MRSFVTYKFLFRQIYIYFFFNYIIMLNIGSRRQVWNGNAKKTSGGLTKSDLIMSHGRIVSKSKHFSAKKEMRLLKYGYGTKKGKFGYVKMNSKKRRKMKGGHSNISRSLSPFGVDGQGITNYDSLGSIGVQEAAGMSGGSGLKSLSSHGSSNWSGDGISGAGITDFNQEGSIGVQLEAGMSGGKRRRTRRHRKH